MLPQNGNFFGKPNVFRMYALLLMVAFVACENTTLTPEFKPLTPEIKPSPVTPEEIGIGQASEYADRDDLSQDAPMTPNNPASNAPLTGLHFLTPADQTWFNEVARGLVLDSKQNLIVVGHDSASTTTYNSQLDLGNAYSGNGKSYYNHDARADVFIQKLSQNGETIWSRKFGGDDFEYARAVAVGPDDTIFVAGMTNSRTVRGLQTPGVVDAFLTAYNTDGKRLWTRVLGGNLDDAATAIAVDRKGYVYVTGYTTGVYTSSETPHRTFMGQTIPGLWDVFLAKYSPKGVRLWTKLIGTNSGSVQRSGGVAVNSKGEVVLTGTTFENVFEAGGENQGFLMRMAADGTLLARPSFFKPDRLGGGLGDISVRSISIDPNDNIIVAGGSTGKRLNDQTSALMVQINQVLGVNAFCGLGRNTIPSGQANDGTFGSCGDGYITKFNPQLEPVWTRLTSNNVPLGLEGSTRPERLIELHTIRTDATGNVFILGYGYTASSNVFEREITANWPLKYSSDGTFLGAAPRLSTNIHEVIGVSGLVSDAMGNVFVSGEVGLRYTGDASPPKDWVFPVNDASNVGSGFNTRAFVTRLNAAFK
jgi:Beta-propeller repeat